MIQQPNSFSKKIVLLLQVAITIYNVSDVSRTTGVVGHDVEAVSSMISKTFDGGSNNKDYIRQQQHLSQRKRKRRLQRTRRNDEEEVDSTSRYIVQYKNDKGRKYLLDVATNVYHDFHRDGYLAVELNTTSLTDLQSNINILKIDIDSIWVADGILERTIDANEFMTNPQYHDRYLAATAKASITSIEQIPYGIEMIQADQIVYGPYTTKVCIVDTGVLGNHPDLNWTTTTGEDRYWQIDSTLLQWDHDHVGHGTHIAGTIAAIPNNNYGVRGIGTIPLYITRGLNDVGRAYESDVIEAMQQCEDVPNTRIISLSLSGPNMSDSMKAIIDRLYRQNVFIVAASGNDGTYSNNYPASYNKVISVGAVDRREQLWNGSNYGPALELTAPGVSIVSTGFTKNGNFTLSIFTGTSMATPHVSGTAAMLWSYFPNCTATQIRYAMAYTAKDKNVTGCDNYYGYGIVQLKDAYDFLLTHPCTASTIWGQDIGNGQCSIIDQIPISTKTTLLVNEKPTKNFVRSIIKVLNNFYKEYIEQTKK